MAGGSTQSIQLTQTPVRAGIKIPTGHILVAEKWRGTELTDQLQNGVSVLYEEKLGVVDFYPSGELGVVYVSEGDLVTGMAYKRKLAKLRVAGSVKGVVLAERTTATNQYFACLQKFAVLELGLTLVPVTTQAEAAGLLTQMVTVENRPQLNQFRLKRKTPAPDRAVLNSLQIIPGLGDVKAQLLLKQFLSIQGICDATIEQLAKVVGKATAGHIKEFFI